MVTARIMIVEDEQITAADLEATLGDLGYSVTSLVSSGKSAISEAAKTHPDLVLMDIRLRGEMDGIEAARQIRERFDIPVIYLTAHADDATLERAKLAEPLGYIVKPFQENELGATIQMALHKHQVDTQAKEREEELSSTLAALGEGVVRVDGMAVVTYLNPAAETWTGWKQQEALGKHSDEVLRFIDRTSRLPVNQYIMRALREGVLTEIPDATALLSRNGLERRIAGSAAPIRDHLDRTSGAVVAFGNVRVEHAPTRASATTGDAGEPPSDDSKIVAQSSAMSELVKFCSRISASGISSILIQGETGTGKDVLAKFLHGGSPRRDRPFVTINCAAIPETLLESELFGYEKGAFTDARAQKKGLLDLANGGTVFLDEIGEVPIHLQAKLLRVLEDQSFRRLGGIKDVNVDVRVIAATNKNLGEAVRKREFREDLFYRLNVIQISIPPLREHRDDILPLVRYFIDLYNRKFSCNIQEASPEAAERLLAHDWPGNVRELRNCIERAMVLEESSQLQPSSLAIGTEALETSDPGAPPRPPVPPPHDMPLEEVEKTLLVRALEQSGGNQTQAARKLGITRDTLRYRMKKHNLKRSAITK